MRALVSIWLPVGMTAFVMACSSDTPSTGDGTKPATTAGPTSQGTDQNTVTGGLGDASTSSTGTSSVTATNSPATSSTSGSGGADTQTNTTSSTDSGTLGSVSTGGATSSSSTSSGGGTTSTESTSTTGGAGGYDSHCTREETEASKAVVREGITEVFINGNGQAIDDYWADPYIQHNPIATSGVDTFKSFFSNVSPGFYSLTRLIGECDKVLIHGSYQGSGATFDMLRVDPELQRMVEHWDASASGDLGQPGEAEEIELTGPNRELVIGFVNDVMIDGNTQNAGNYLSDALVVHSQGVNGAEALVQRIMDQSISYSTIHHQIADGNFVYTLSEGAAQGTAYGFHELFRVADGKIVEYWDGRLRVQDGASGAGIF
jgi:predicted SnoaL-like aldol condensation-catalyzing enzyme